MSADRWCLKTTWWVIQELHITVMSMFRQEMMFSISFQLFFYPESKDKGNCLNLIRNLLIYNPLPTSICSKIWLCNYLQYLLIRSWPGSILQVNNTNKINIETGRMYRLQSKYVSLNIKESSKLKCAILFLRKSKQMR